MTSDNVVILGIIVNSLISVTAIRITYAASKKNRWNDGVTQFRQEWIENLRTSISIFITEAQKIGMLDLEDDDSYFEFFTDFCQEHMKIQLMLNPLEKDHNQLVAKMEEIKKTVHREEVRNIEAFNRSIERKVAELLVISKAVLKKEWNVVKDGK